MLPICDTPDVCHAAASGKLTFYVLLIVATILLGLSKGGFTGVGMAAMPIVTLGAPPAQAAAVSRVVAGR